MIKHSLFFAVLLFSFAYANLLHSQEIDTLMLSKKLLSEKNYEAADELLETYYANHENDLYAGWMYGQSLHYTKQYEKSRDIYTATIKLFPKNEILPLDYSNKLVESGELDKAVITLSPLAASNSGDYALSAKETLAKIYYWQGEYEEALKMVNSALESNKNNPKLIDLRKKLLRAQSNWFNFEAFYLEDDQPLTKITPKLETGIYLNSKSSVGLSVDLPVFIIGDSTFYSQSITGKTQFRFNKHKVKLNVDAGIIKFPSDEWGWLGSFQLEKNLHQHLNVTLKGEHQPYLATTAAISNKLMQTNLGISLSWDDTNGWLGKATFEMNHFLSMENYILKENAWLVSPPITFSIVNFRLGYGINYSHSKENTFSSVNSISDIQASGDTTGITEGFYDPFFSPEKQIVHSAIGMLRLKASNKITWGLKVNYGFYAKTNTPYLYLFTNNNGKVVLKTAFNTERYHPMEIGSDLSYKINSKMEIKASYSYLKTNYYISQYAGLTTKLIF